MNCQWFVLIGTVAIVASACGSNRDRTPVGDASSCGALLCTGGQVCCTDCAGSSMCADTCPAIGCTDAATPPDAGEGSACLTQEDCGSAALSCVPPGTPRVCGIGCDPERLCEGADGCDPGQICLEYVASCCFAGELSSRCEAACTATSCAEGDQCGDDGRCTPIACSDGYACPPHTECNGTGDEHGCQRTTCSSSAECAGEGACVSGACYAEPGICQGPAA